MTQPQSQVVAVGTDVVFTVAASGPSPLIYQWQFENTNLSDNGHIVGSQSNVLTIADVQLSDAGNYQVVISNSNGSITSQTATLSIIAPVAPNITSNPGPQNSWGRLAGLIFCIGNGVAIKLPMVYKWYRSQWS